MHRELERVVERFLPVLQWLSASQCQQQLPRRVESWSVQQNVVHLVLTYRSTAQLLERCLAQGPPPSDRPALGQIAPRLLVIGLGIFPRGAKSPERVHPDRLTLPAKSGAVARRTGAYGHAACGVRGKTRRIRVGFSLRIRTAHGSPMEALSHASRLPALASGKESAPCHSFELAVKMKVPL